MGRAQRPHGGFGMPIRDVGDDGCRDFCFRKRFHEELCGPPVLLRVVGGGLLGGRMLLLGLEEHANAVEESGRRDVWDDLGVGQVFIFQSNIVVIVKAVVLCEHRLLFVLVVARDRYARNLGREVWTQMRMHHDFPIHKGMLLHCMQRLMPDTSIFKQREERFVVMDPSNFIVLEMAEAQGR
ncbi:hypothetical protein H257_09075 [Aphanomyces astaci]|uniref:Uncharacterized protein n=1 Tax=Aphanomyces astaci TaxID=112090 RepID=W4GE13_APHAT|nr:hypothetical protein H257_09075 [Aphanomyces astaci]ETV77188.1 hypothetical protein H257_09075 [Aphanomyces astaci]|eukprot:XP_009833494.1 hypothetical protein H257_09075 [Aphanomyces astaci]